MGPYDNAGLGKFLAGKQASIELELGSYVRDISGSAVPPRNRGADGDDLCTVYRCHIVGR